MAAAIASLATACVVQTVEPAPRSAGVDVTGPPPPPEAEAPPPPRPHVTSVWVGGYWHWNGMQWSWIPGHWEVHAPPGSRWRAPRYTVRGTIYVYEPGGWIR